MKKTILLFGKDGQLGFMLTRTLSLHSNLFSFGKNECDLTKKDEIRNVIKSIKPDVIVNAAAYTAVDKAEINQNLAYKINALAVNEMSKLANKFDALLVHLSTDYVFDGKKLGPYTEKNITNPINIYGKSKLAGEDYIRENLKNFLIIRTSWVYGNYKNNFLKSILKALIEEKNIKVVKDQYGSPTSTSLLSDMISHVIINFYFKDKENFPYGLYNLTSQGKTNWFDFAKLIKAEEIKNNINFKDNKSKIMPITSHESNYLALRPMNSELTSNLFKRTFKINLPNWRRDVRFVMKQIN